jgi:hypothetical protein
MKAPVSKELWKFAAVSIVSAMLATPSAVPKLAAAETPALSTTSRQNMALASSGATARASSTYGSGFAAAGVIDGDRTGSSWGSNGGWNDGTSNSWPDWFEVDFAAPSAIDEIDLFSVQDAYWAPQNPTAATTFSQFGLTSFTVQYWDGGSWQNVPGGTVAGNNLVWRQVTFSPVTTSKVRVLITGALAGWSRIAEIEAWGNSDGSISSPAPGTGTNPAPGSGSTGGRQNLALTTSGASAVTSSTHDAGYAAAGAINGDRAGTSWGNGGGWNDGTSGSWPDWYEVDLAGSSTIDEIDLFNVQDAYWAPGAPSAGQTFSLYGITDFQVQYWNGSAWQTVPGGAISGNNLVWRQLTFPALTTTKVRVWITGALSGWSRIAELEVWGTGGGASEPGSGGSTPGTGDSDPGSGESTPGSGTPGGTAPPIPELSNWQSRMTSYGTTHCNQAAILAAIGSGGVFSEDSVWYYDGAKVYQQIAQYTGNSDWYRCAGYSNSAYKSWVLALTQGLSLPTTLLGGWRVFPEGLANDYRRTGDMTSKDAALRLANYSAFAGSGGSPDCGVTRETAYVLNAYLVAEELGAPRHPAFNTAVNNLLGDLNRSFVTNECGVVPFMTGLAMEALIHYYERTGDPRVPPALETAADEMWRRFWQAPTESFVYDSRDPETGAPDLNLLIAPAYAFLWQLTGEQRFLDRGDQIFAGGVRNSWLGSAKAFSQNYRTSFNYVKWRSQPAKSIQPLTRY